MKSSDTKRGTKEKFFCISFSKSLSNDDDTDYDDIKTNKDDDDERRINTLYSNKTCNKHVHISCKNVSLPFTCRNSVICLTMRLCTATPNWVSFNKRATVIWGNFFTVLGVVVVVACSSSFGCCFVGVASSFSSSATDGGVVFVFLDVFFFVVFSVILFVFCVREKVRNFQLFYVSVYSSIVVNLYHLQISLHLSFSPFKLSSPNKNNLITWLE